MATTTATYTLADLLELPDDGPRYELLGGELVLMPPPGVAHALIVGELFGWFYEAQRAGYGLAGCRPCAVGLDYLQRGMRGIDGPEPDVFFVVRERTAIMRGPFVQGVPDLIIEVLSKKTRKKGSRGGRKWQAYERNAVPHYWLVDPDARTVTQYEHRDGRFVEVATLRGEDALRCPLFPTPTRTVAELFANVRD